MITWLSCEWSVIVIFIWSKILFHSSSLLLLLMMLSIIMITKQSIYGLFCRLLLNKKTRQLNGSGKSIRGSSNSQCMMGPPLWYDKSCSVVIVVLIHLHGGLLLKKSIIYLFSSPVLQFNIPVCFLCQFYTVGSWLLLDSIAFIGSGFFCKNVLQHSVKELLAFILLH